ncbi:peptidase domain-containing ABC transporter [Kordia algicida OT-1]|uniref:Putative hemolysin secretion transport system ATP-binding protein n=1 Tax=Kordia algicida OT-1 TaxID=391587 RepID=A9DVH7_9FLAO|nr:peptidase domain-containing ABC transporter [Kordia algicida]EDP96423.1 putative hemolysin secretion transport system ATP-binding protein [Kordia algicida OT-1]
MLFKRKIKFLPQHDQMDCGPACLQMISRYYGKKYSLQYLRDRSFLTKDGVSMLGISNSAKNIGFDVLSLRISVAEVIKKIDNPCILHWNQNHFVVLNEIRKKPFTGELEFVIADPGHGIIKLTEQEFKKQWCIENDEGVLLYLEPSEEFYAKKEVPKAKKDKSTSFLFSYMKSYKWELTQLIFGLIAGSLITLVFPFLTQALIDNGVKDQSIDIIKIILIGQLFLFFGSAIIEIIRNWITLYIGSHINIKIISDFLLKLMKLPIRFFDSKMMGDFTQRISDHERIENFLTSQSLLTLFSLINLCVFLVVLGIYDMTILGVFIVLTTVAIVWVFIFQRKRKILDYIRFQSKALNQDAVYEMINGMQEIKLNNFEKFKRNEWVDIQLKLFKISTKILVLDQYQSVGYSFINHFKNILVTYFAAKEVILGNISLGAMLSITYIIGQMNGPLNQLITFIRSLQDAQISLDRLSEVHTQKEEESNAIVTDNSYLDYKTQSGIRLANLSFSYDGTDFRNVLKNLDLHIPRGKTTAIVGASGSGKTTLMKLLLKFYAPSEGHIFINDTKLQDISAREWRKNIGVVMQEGYIFSDTIERNIATADDEIDAEKMAHAIKTSNLQEFVEELPNGLKTKIGASGNGVSGGQKQRILIARAVYKNPDFLFFDEATSALDTENERVIMENVNAFIKNRTAVIIAHRLSTVKNADQIVVLQNGNIVETGKHDELVMEQGYYYNLVKDQLELNRAYGS